MISHFDFADAAASPKLIGIPYSKLDCQALVERVLSDVGIKRNWRGSNHMWRDACQWRGTFDECLEKFGEIPPGACLFTVKHDGGEVKRGYHDNEGNAAHVGINIGNNVAIHSSTGGVQLCETRAARWTHVGFFKDIDFSDVYNDDDSDNNEVVDAINRVLDDLIIVKTKLNAYISALENLRKAVDKK